MEKHEVNPFFSIVIPTLNEERYLPQLLLDLCRQTFRNFEVTIVDARSEDQTVLKARQFQNRFERFRIVESDKRNVSHQRNLGVQTARGDWLIFFDADNRLPRDFLYEIRAWIEQGKPDLLSTWFKPDSEDLLFKTIVLLSNITIALRKNTGSPVIREAFVCVNKQAFLQLQGFNETVPLREGSELLKRAYQANLQFRLYRKPTFVCSYRRVRKQGVMRTFLRSLQIELVKLVCHRISEETSRMMYPMEGGKYFEMPASSRRADNRDSLGKVLKRIFKPQQM
jgi:glycosyltransferase involved in cell wall biosynthesis